MPSPLGLFSCPIFLFFKKLTVQRDSLKQQATMLFCCPNLKACHCQHQKLIKFSLAMTSVFINPCLFAHYCLVQLSLLTFDRVEIWNHWVVITSCSFLSSLFKKFKGEEETLLIFLCVAFGIKCPYLMLYILWAFFFFLFPHSSRKKKEKAANSFV